MPPVLKVNGFDLSTFLRVQPDDGLDPVDVEFENPQFGGAPALAEGGVFVAETSRNKEFTVPLWTNSVASKAQGVNDLIETVNNVLDRGPAAVEFRPEGASQSTFFDLEAGRLDPQYSHFHHRRGWTKTTAHLWTKPYGHTGTMRSVVPSQKWPGASGPVNILATGLQGDKRALVNLYANASQTGMFMYGITPLPSFNPFIHATRFAFGDTSTVSILPGASALGGAVRQMALSPGATSVELDISLGPGDYCGRNRVFLLCAHNFTGTPAAGASGVVQAWMVDETFDALNPVLMTTATQIVPSAGAGLFQMGLIDMGEVTVASQVPGAVPVATTTLGLRFLTNLPTYSATYALLLNGLIVIPLDHSAGIVGSHAMGFNHALRSWPQREAQSSFFTATNAAGFGPSGLFGGDFGKLLRGDLPRMPEGASQAKIVAYSLKAGGQLGNHVLGMTVQVDALERWKFLR